MPREYKSMQSTTFRQANTQFALNLLRAVFNSSAALAGPARCAVQLSPFSTRRGITMAGIGARNDTRAAILETLCLPASTDLDEVNADNLKVARALRRAEAANSKARTELHIANALWLRQDTDGYQFLPEFVEANQDYYEAEVAQLPFDAQALAKINQWCRDNTGQKIDTILDSLSANDKAVLTDALYLKTPAKNRFYRRNDEVGDFALLDGGTTSLTYMKQHAEMRYFRDANLEVVEFPFGSSGIFNLYVLLPAPKSNLVQLVGKMQASNWQMWKSNLKPAEGWLRIAQNEQQWGADLVPELSRLGMGAAFSDEVADFLAMCTKKLKIDSIIHKTYTKLTHKGFEGAAITAVRMAVLGCHDGPDLKFDVTVNRPYAWLVTGGDEILFAGTTTLPTAPAVQDTDD